MEDYEVMRLSLLEALKILTRAKRTLYVTAFSLTGDESCRPIRISYDNQMILCCSHSSRYARSLYEALHSADVYSETETVMVSVVWEELRKILESDEERIYLPKW
jgi:hypothetical protein